jgi:hypothetical protein
MVSEVIAMAEANPYDRSNLVIIYKTNRGCKKFMQINRILLILILSYSSMHAQSSLLEQILGQDYEKRQVTAAEFKEKYAVFWERGKKAAPDTETQFAVDELLAPLQNFLLQGLERGQLEECAAIADEIAKELETHPVSPRERAQKAAQRWS